MSGNKKMSRFEEKPNNVNDTVYYGLASFAWSHKEGKPLFEMCWFYMGIAQIALDLPPSVKRANVGKSAPDHPGKPFHPRAMWEKKCPKPSRQAFTPSCPYGQCPYGKNAFQKGASRTSQDGQGS